ncbi:hypothetical protein EHEL_040400 [Encephalitozoon hellem ATCC 50504]|uniref:Uncharacterized protein n=1 Tax=Encephalitozoon hellem TaxID=27973 RepID=A0A9Q9CBS7_ENCHE|nr:uncharacterized protein EHEL_040400 [Encephalitozoon hellem ATCC 50504]AFM98091.1 hypothetical protein EHEL_040400 [Encephalitozoon hellem ATCC 50504]UTX42933.1 hypothetical protein GPU96_04g06640 [Encephalitozoon hellem]|eukprot:XP_003887072.1 hypothetical protein EHEL_040400 [Encephalitozoon hellem ATCC 50504]
MEGKLFADAPDIPLKLIQGVVDCKEFVVYDGNVFCLTGRNTLIALSSGEEYKFYGDVLKMGVHGHYIYLVFRTSKIIVFDVIRREVVINFQGIEGCIKKAVVNSSGMHFLSSDGCLYRSTFEDVRYMKDSAMHAVGGRNPTIQNFWVHGDSVFYTTCYGHVYKDSEMVLKVFDTVKLIVPNREYLYVVTEGNMLLKYDAIKWRVLFRENIEGLNVIGNGVIGWNGIAIDLLKEVRMRVPKDTRWIERYGKTMYISTLAGIFSGSLSD